MAPHSATYNDGAAAAVAAGALPAVAAAGVRYNRRRAHC